MALRAEVVWFWLGMFLVWVSSFSIQYSLCFLDPKIVFKFSPVWIDSSEIRNAPKSGGCKSHAATSRISLFTVRLKWVFQLRLRLRLRLTMNVCHLFSHIGGIGFDWGATNQMGTSEREWGSGWAIGTFSGVDDDENLFRDQWKHADGTELPKAFSEDKSAPEMCVNKY